MRHLELTFAANGHTFSFPSDPITKTNIPSFYMQIFFRSCQESSTQLPQVAVLYFLILHHHFTHPAIWCQRLERESSAFCSSTMLCTSDRCLQLENKGLSLLTNGLFILQRYFLFPCFILQEEHSLLTGLQIVL